MVGCAASVVVLPVPVVVLEGLEVTGLLLVVAGCGGSSPTGGGGGGGGGGGDPVLTTSVMIGNDFFSPPDILVSSGAMATWTWAGGGDDHNVTFECAVERRVFLVGANPTQRLSLPLVAARAIHGGNDMG